ncbi:MAG: flagellar protein FliT [Deltaproteobacteria bacterium]|nr:flagellar protein FliT [Deltaproteobacteria bacterium]MBW2101279.1 flagellar protein FliT [Deltaproteobacteria bacterium]MBW2347638.1 flagellar protein FliT [Deltaproteobacteria bacterium]
MESSTENLKNALDALQGILRIAEAQKQAVLGGVMEEFFSLGEQREALQAAFDREKAKFMEQRPGTVGEARTLFENMEALLQDIRDRDEETRALIEKRREEISGEMRRLRRGREALRGYGRRQHRPSLFNIKG